MICPNCGREIADDSNYCEYCGTKVRGTLNKKTLWITVGVLAAVCIVWGVWKRMPILYEEQVEETSILSKDTLSVEGNKTSVSNGRLMGKFSIAPGKQVQFAQGNLQYQASTDIWRFAEHQYEYIGEINKNLSSTYSGWIDLFGWGTGNAPTKSSTDYNSDYISFTDWGVNPISNGGNMANQWRTLTRNEWVYLFHGRANYANLFGIGKVDGVAGTILLPDDWVTPSGLTFTPSTIQGLEWQRGRGFYSKNSNNDNLSYNAYTLAQWELMESAGAVFLPAAGSRDGTEVYGVSSSGRYWSATRLYTYLAYYLDFHSSYLCPWCDNQRDEGCSVRLVFVL